MFPALDATAGERERSTWETMLSTATHKINVIIAKYAYVVTLSAMAGMLIIFCRHNLNALRDGPITWRQGR